MSTIYTVCPKCGKNHKLVCGNCGSSNFYVVKRDNGPRRFKWYKYYICNQCHYEKSYIRCDCGCTIQKSLFHNCGEKAVKEGGIAVFVLWIITLLILQSLFGIDETHIVSKIFAGIFIVIAIVGIMGLIQDCKKTKGNTS